jgi:hypothetical protein
MAKRSLSRVSQAIQELLKNHPHFRAPGGSIEAFEFLSMPGMAEK